MVGHRLAPGAKRPDQTELALGDAAPLARGPPAELESSRMMSNDIPPVALFVYHQANDMASLRAFLDSAELKEGMERAGVAEPPDIRFVEVSDFAGY